MIENLHRCSICFVHILMKSIHGTMGSMEAILPPTPNPPGPLTRLCTAPTLLPRPALSCLLREMTTLLRGQRIFPYSQGVLSLPREAGQGPCRGWSMVDPCTMQSSARLGVGGGPLQQRWCHRHALHEACLLRGMGVECYLFV